MQHIVAIHLTTARRWRPLVMGVVVAAFTGMMAAFVRPRIRGPVHYEMIASLFVVLPAICFCLSLSLRRVLWRRAVGWLVLEVSAVCLAFLAAWLAVFGRVWDDMLRVMTVFWLIAAGLSVALLIGWQQLRRPLVGPYCPRCDYCLIGVPTDRCPECGRDFSLAELGVTREALRPSHAAMDRHRVKPLG